VEVKKWVSFAALINVNDNKPPELIEMSLIRAHFCENVAIKMDQNQNSDAFFLTGLFSLLDAMLDVHIKILLEDVMLPELTHDALMGKSNEAHGALSLIVALEQGKWEDVLRISGVLGVNGGDMAGLYADSLQWSAELHKNH
jgi:EAL and modified HD-GYP domain-containing signal transduction protein